MFHTTVKTGDDFESNTYVHKENKLILSKPIEKSTEAFSCKYENA